jgi:hypothetical protein
VPVTKADFKNAERLWDLGCLIAYGTDYTREQSRALSSTFRPSLLRYSLPDHAKELLVSHDQSGLYPGNAELAITVGSTHRDMPHVYGVSYFSSKGPTGDGRMKPDLVAPGYRGPAQSGQC